MYIQYICYLAYANLITHSLSYPKSRDAIASKKLAPHDRKLMSSSANLKNLFLICKTHPN